MGAAEGESLENVQQRYDNLKYCLGTVKHLIEGLQTNSKVFSQLIDFIKTSHGSATEPRLHGVIREIPTAVLITGVNMPDHDIIFSQLVTDLSLVTPYTAVMKSKDCTAMKSTMKNMMVQFMDCEIDDDEEIRSPRQAHSKLSSMPQLCRWYTRRCQSEGPNVSPAMVIIFEDFEGFPAHIVQDFITICSQYADHLPLVLVFGVATSVAAIHQVLPHSVSTLLSIQRFQSQPSLVCLQEIISQVLMTPKYSFKLGAKVFRFLYENFLFHDFSLQNFSTGLQFCILEHFYCNPASILCCPSSADREDIIRELTDDELDIIRSLLSFKRHVESCNKQQQAQLLTDSGHTKEVIIELLNGLDSYHWYFFPILDCLHAMAANLPRLPLGKKVRDLYEYSLSPTHIYHQDKYRDALALLRVLAKDELVEIIIKCVNILEKFLETALNAKKCPDLFNYKKNMLEFLEQFEKLSEQQEPVRPATLPTGKGGTPKIVNRFELQEKLRLAATQKRKDTPYDQLRQKTVDYMDSLFRKHLRSPQSLPLHEVMYFDKLHKVKEHLIGMPRAAIQTALSDPRHYLKCECCEIEAGAIQVSLPDVSVAYKLYLECSRMINLYDWLQAFKVVLDPDPKASTKTPSKKQKKSDAQLQARFIRAVSELQFMGFIKPTKRKTDHVQRLTWGGC
ncbi:origin recognition complex subunit 3 isoform X2 [Nematostella vectensis]|nr:origin recognition complex subunit 3 isoform X2 [Nematostella vectensis]XP_032238006.2 origin recognition complex subunit 3 isoform X2 [Nematostella vectensis]